MKNGVGTYLGLDVGSSVCKGVLLDSDGGTLAVREEPVVWTTPAPGRVECAAAECVEPFRRVVRRLSADAEYVNRPVTAVAVSGAAGSTLSVASDGTPGTVIGWLDARSSGNPPASLAGLTSGELRRITGWPCLDSFPLAQLAWRREHEPEALERAAWVGLNTDYMQYRLSGRHAMDFSTATTMHLVDQVRRDYCDGLLKRAGVRREQLSGLVDPGVPVGNVTEAAAIEFGLPEACLVVAGSFDHPSAARAAGVLEPGDLLLSCGTSFVGFLPVADRETVMADPALLCDPFLSCEGGAWGAIFSSTALGRRIDSLVRRFLAGEKEPNPFRLFDELAVAARQRGLHTVIDPSLDYDAPPVADREELALGVMLGAAKLLADRLGALRAAGMELRRGKLAGGICRSPIFPELIAEATGLELEPLDGSAGARGAALLARKGALAK